MNIKNKLKQTKNFDCLLKYFNTFYKGEKNTYRCLEYKKKKFSCDVN